MNHLKHRHFILRFVVSAAVILISFYSVCQLLIYKLFSDAEYPTSATFMNFYKLEPDSVDVLFLGSSHVQTGFIPQILYDEYGITSYNLGSNAQSVLLSYYLLKEALCYQNPDVIVLETYMLFPCDGYEDEPLNCSDAEIRQVIDSMRWGLNRLQAVYDICKYDESLNPVSYLLPNVRYHYRWKYLEENDFRICERMSAQSLMGYIMFSGRNNLEYQPLTADDTDTEEAKEEEILPLMRQYLDEITALCLQEGIELILVNTPSANYTVNRHDSIEQYAEDYDIPFYDFNEAEIYDEILFDFNGDMRDSGHMNLSGAQKLTQYLGQLLQSEFGMGDHSDEQWESARDDYEDALTDYEIKFLEDLDGYLSLLIQNSDQYTIFIAAQDEASYGLSGNSQDLLRQLGLTADWSDAYRKSYCAVIEGGTVLLESMSNEQLDYTGSFLNGLHRYAISSSGFNAGGSSSIILDQSETELSIQSRGLNIVVFNNATLTVVDSVCFDTYEGEDRNAKR